MGMVGILEVSISMVLFLFLYICENMSCIYVYAYVCIYIIVTWVIMGLEDTYRASNKLNSLSQGSSMFC